MSRKPLPARLRFLFGTVFFCFAFGAPSLSLPAQFLVPDQQYRCPDVETTCQSPHHLSDFEQRPLEHPRFSVNYVEFNDGGGFWDPHELDDALAQLRKAPDNGRPTIVVVYINGWKNNADIRQCKRPPCGDVDKFRDDLLARLATDHPLVNVVGIYLSWRGLTFTVEPFKTISYWPRRKVARTIGQKGIYKTLTDINDVVAPRRKRYFVILAGHSFGARVLENAADAAKTPQQHSGFMTDYRDNQRNRSAPTAQIQSGDLSRPDTTKLNTGTPVDLIVYLNAATASTVTRRTLKDIAKLCGEDPSSEICKTDPFYLAITSHADVATGIIMPIANAVLPAISSDGLHLISAANTPSLHTHHDPKSRNPSSPGCPSEQSQPIAGFCFGTGTGGEGFEVVPIRGKTQGQFWIFNVGRNVIGNHGDVWNPP